MDPPHGTTVSTYLIEKLYQVGVRHLFSVPGDYICSFLDAVDHRGDIARVGNCNEMNAGYAADAYARVTGVAAVAVTYGVGAFSLLNAIAGAFVERLPV